MRHHHTSIVIGLLCGLGTMPPAQGGEWGTIYGAARDEARQVSSASLAVPMPPAQWEATVARRREMWREMLGLSPLQIGRAHV